jgi:hypothetical protein
VREGELPRAREGYVPGAGGVRRCRQARPRKIEADSGGQGRGAIGLVRRMEQDAAGQRGIDKEKAGGP